MGIAHLCDCVTRHELYREIGSDYLDKMLDFGGHVREGFDCVWAHGQVMVLLLSEV